MIKKSDKPAHPRQSACRQAAEDVISILHSFTAWANNECQFGEHRAFEK